MNLIFNSMYYQFVNYNETFSLVLLNVFVYLFLLFSIFSLFFIFDLRYIRTLNELKNCGNLFFITTSLLILLLSLAGLPPLFGFTGKFLLFIYLIKTSNWFVFFFFSLLNFFIIYFYIQNLRFVVSKSSLFFFFFNKHHVYLNFKLSNFLVSLNFFNFFGIFFLGEFIIYFSFMSSFLLFN